MLDYVIRGYVLIGLLTFALRAALPELPMPAWTFMLGYVLLVGIGYGIYYVASQIPHLVAATKTMKVWRIHADWGAHHPA